MNRSIFQILLIKWSYNLFFAFIVLLILNAKSNFYCFSIKGIPDILLKELQYNNILFRCSKEIPNDAAFTAIDNFILNKSNKLNYSVAKYFEVINGFYVPFNFKSCYAHPNLFFGEYNNLYFNLQFSHHPYNLNFKHLSTTDISDYLKHQYLCNQLYVYKGGLNQQFLNYNDLYKNNFIVYKEDCDGLKVQNYIDTNNGEFNSILKNVLKV